MFSKIDYSVHTTEYSTDTVGLKEVSLNKWVCDGLWHREFSYARIRFRKRSDGIAIQSWQASGGQAVDRHYSVQGSLEIGESYGARLSQIHMLSREFMARAVFILMCRFEERSLQWLITAIPESGSKGQRISMS